MKQTIFQRSVLALALAVSGAAMAQGNASPTTPAAPNTPVNPDNATSGQRAKPGESAQTTGTSKRDAMGATGAPGTTGDYNSLPPTNAGTVDPTTTNTTGTTDSSTVKTPDKGPHTKTKATKKRHHKRGTTSGQADPYENNAPTSSGNRSGTANPEMGTTSPPVPAASK